MIDFQCCRISSPAVDLAYTLVTGTRGVIRVNRLDHWLKLYYDKFAFEMKVLGHDASEVFPYKSFKEDFDNLYVYGFVWATLHVQVCCWSCSPPAAEYARQF